MLTIQQLPMSLFEALQVEPAGAHLRVINDSLINTTYCLTENERRFLVKAFHADETTGLSRTSLFEMQRQIASCGVAPMPLFLSEDNRLYVEEWIPACPQPVSILPDSERLDLLAHALNTAHMLGIETQVLPMPERWQAYVKSARLQPDDPLVARVKGPEADYFACVQNSDDLVFCHNDLAFGHIFASQPMKIIDWEYAATGNRYFDLGSAFIINRLNQTQQRHVCAKYAQLSELPERQVVDGVAHCSPMVNLTYKLWYAAITEHLKQ